MNAYPTPIEQIGIGWRNHRTAWTCVQCRSIAPLLNCRRHQIKTLSTACCDSHLPAVKPRFKHVPAKVAKVAGKTSAGS